MRWWAKYGFTLQEIADHMGVTRGRVWQLAVRDSPRIKFAVRDLEIAQTLVERARRVKHD